MYQVKILPDEFWRGYLGRLKQINLHNKATDTIRALRSQSIEGKRYRIEPIGHLLSNALHMQEHELNRDHNIPSFLFAPIETQKRPGRGAHLLPERLRFPTLWSTPRGASFCPDCVAEDEWFWGFSYWRRTHQTPGIGHCPKHGTHLARIPSSSAFDHMPCLAGNVDPAWDGVAPAEYEVLHRYSDVALALLERYRGFHESDRRKVHFMGFLIRKTSDKTATSIAEEIRAKLPTAWLRTYFPAFLDSTALQLDGRIALLPIALVLTALFDSAEEVLAYWSSQEWESYRHPYPDLTFSLAENRNTQLDEECCQS